MTRWMPFVHSVLMQLFLAVWVISSACSTRQISSLVSNATESCPIFQNFMKERKKGSDTFVKIPLPFLSFKRKCKELWACQHQRTTGDKSLIFLNSSEFRNATSLPLIHAEMLENYERCKKNHPQVKRCHCHAGRGPTTTVLQICLTNKKQGRHPRALMHWGEKCKYVKEKRAPQTLSVSIRKMLSEQQVWSKLNM